MAVIGDAFASALPPSHAGPSRPPLNAGASVPAAGRVLDDRVLELLWRIALRWGRPSAAGVALPEAVDARALSLVLGIGEPEAGLALETLRERGVILLAGAVHLRLTGAVHASRRDRLLAAAARQLALARAAHDDCLAVCEGLDAGGRRPRANDQSVIG
jgi:sugar phosphate isomerase/epimerase